MVGIYQIRNITNGSVYVGSAKNIVYRWTIHRRQLTDGKHHSRYLQRAWNRYGPQAFVFEVVEECQVDELLVREQFYIDERTVYPRRMTYNVNPSSKTRLGARVNAASRKRMSESGKKRPSMPDVTRIKIGNTMAAFRGRSRSLRGPDGTVYENISNMRRFCREHGIRPESIQAVTSGVQRSHKGWMLSSSVAVRYIITSPSGELFSGVPELKQFCIEHNLNYKSMHQYMQSGNKYMGWMVTTESNQRRRRGRVIR